MKRFLLLALTAGLLFTNEAKTETWTRIARFSEGQHLYERWIDVKSIFKNGDWVYANMQRGSSFTYSKYEDPNKLGRAEPVSIKVNCKKAIFKDEGLSFRKREKTGLWSSFPDASESPALSKYYEDNKSKDFYKKMYGARKSPEAEGAYQLLCKQWKH